MVKSLYCRNNLRGICRAIAIKKLINFEGVKKILDIGGGSGIFASTFIKDNPALSAVVFDLPNVISLTKEYIEKENMSDRISTLTGNYLSRSYQLRIRILYFSLGHYSQQFL